LQDAAYKLEAQYVTLAGHRLRWKLTYNARQAIQFHELHTRPQAAPETRAIVRRMHERLAEVHPMIADAMRFVGQTDGQASPSTVAAKTTPLAT
jgi:thymidylate synthase ThyX